MRLIKTFFLVSFVFFAFDSYLFSFSFKELTAKLDVDRANMSFRNGNYENAVSLYERALSKLPNSPEIYYNMGTTMSSIGETDTAIRLFDMAKKNFNEKTSRYMKNATYYNSGIAKIEKEDYVGAISELIDSLVNNPKDENSKRALEYAQKKLKEQKNNSGPKDQNSQDNEEGESDDNGGNDNSENGDNRNNNNQNNNNEKSDIDRLLESLRQFRKDKENEEQYYGGGRIDKDW